ncbi:MAG TPA: carboxypeptidase-like regulatory domain-containing protein [Candidatus Sulfotelmatobacter sp.]|nr:carboxypeptidase-like regulatory domain-containing protein [Candidatus Sulfotelmatobacter sp.]
MPSRARQLAVLIGTFLVLSSFASAQSATTSLHGVVTDAKGAVVVGAVVTLTDPATALSRNMTTNGQGEYQFLELPPATYELTVKSRGFATVKETNVQLLVRTPATLNVTLQVATGIETVEVNATATLVNTDNATMGHVFDSQQIQALPFEGREPTSILTLQSGVTFTGNNMDKINSTTQSGFDADSRSGSVNGGRSDQTNVTLDGTDDNDQATGRLQGSIRVPLDSLQEFRVTTANSDADTGRSSGGQVALVTKSGTNNWHGGAYEYYRPTFSGNDWFIKASQVQSGLPNRPPFLLRNTYGAFVGGPIKKDRLFFFLSFEGMRKREDQSVIRTVPSDDLRNGFLTYQCDATDPNCPSSGTYRLTPTQLAALDPNCASIGSCTFSSGAHIGSFPGANPYVMDVFNQYPHPNSSSVGDGLNALGYTFNSPAPDNLNMYVAKLDYNLTANGTHRLFVRGVQDGDHNAAGAAQFPGQPNSVVEVVTSKGITAGYTATFKNSWINNLRYGYVRQAYDDRGLQTQHYVHFRFLDNINAFSKTNQRHVPVTNIVDDVSKQWGKHSIQFGGNLRKIDNVGASNYTSYFTASTNPDWLNPTSIAGSGGSLDPSSPEGAKMNLPAVSQSFYGAYNLAMTALAGLISEVDSNYNLDKNLNPIPEGALIDRHFRSWEYEWYLQDAWRMRPNLTLTYGLRYSLLEPPYEATGTQVQPLTSTHDWFINRGIAAAQGQTYFPQTGTDSSGNPVYDHNLEFALGGQANGKKPYWGYDYRNFAPRLALAYSPNGDSGFWKSLWGGPGKSSIRVGYGLYFDHFGEGITSTFDREGAFGLSSSVSNPAGIQTVDGAARFTDLNTIPTTSLVTTSSCPTAPCSLTYPAPSGSFPVTFPYAFQIGFGLDDKLKTPYSHVVNFSITRDLGRGFVLETSFVGRYAHRLLAERDLAQPANLKDPKSGMTYYQAATALAKQYWQGADIASVAPIAYWENLFPLAGSNATNKGYIYGCAPNAGGLASYTSTQAIYDLYSCFSGKAAGAANETYSLAYLDVPGYSGSTASPNECFPACATINGQTTGYAFWSPQYSSLDSWSSIGNSAYNSGQVSLRHHTGNLTFDLNYTYSKSIDIGSNAERISVFEGLGFSSQIINAWMPNQLRGPSDFDTTHAINANWVYQLPVGKGRRFGAGMGKVADAILGGWQVSGLWRWSTGFPFSVYPFYSWPTNWDLESNAILVGKKPQTGQFIVAQSGGGTGPNVFKDPGITDPTNPNAAINQFRDAYPGESGQRNELRGPGAFNIDMGLAKEWKITESQNLRFSWEVFNVTNTVRFDAGNIQNVNNFTDYNASFGNFINTLFKPRIMQLGGRYTF